LVKSKILVGCDRLNDVSVWMCMYLSTVGWYSVTHMIIVVDFGSSPRPSHAKLGTWDVSILIRTPLSVLGISQRVKYEVLGVEPRWGS